MKDDSFKKHEKELDEIGKKLTKSIKGLFDSIGKACIDAAEEHEKLIGVTAQEAMNNMDNALGGWNDLDIDNLPERFSTRDDIEIEIVNNKTSDMNKFRSKKENRSGLINNIMYGEVKYRYRLKPLESIRITKEDHKTIDDAMMHLARAIHNRRYKDDGHMLSMNKTMGDLAKLLQRVEIIK